MNKGIIIRSMREYEIDIVTNLWNKLCYDQIDRDNYYNQDPNLLIDLNKAKRYFVDCFKNNNCFIFVAEYKDKLVGFVEMWLHKKDFFFIYEDYAYVLNGFVDKEVKITNLNPLYIPFKLFETCENKAIELGYKYIGGDVFDFNVQMNNLMKLYHVLPYRTRYMKRLINDE